MKPSIFLVVFCAMLVIGCSKKKEDESQQKDASKIQNEQESTPMTADEKGKYYQEMTQEVNDIYTDLERTKAKESQLMRRGGTEGYAATPDQTMQDLHTIGYTLRENRKKIDDLQTRMKSYRGEISDLNQRLVNLKQSLRDREKSVADIENGIHVNPETHRARLSDAEFRMRERSLIVELASDNTDRQAYALQSLRSLQETYPDRSYSLMVIPLMKIVKDEGANVPVRMDAAYALHAAHSDRGDYAIESVSTSAKDTRLSHLCTTLAAERTQEQQLARDVESREGSTSLTRR